MNVYEISVFLTKIVRADSDHKSLQLYYGQRGHSPSPASQSIDHLMGKTARGHGGHYGPIPPYSGYPNYQAYQSSYAQQHYHRGPPQDGATNAETSPPPVYEYLSASRPGKENFSSKFR